MNNFPLKPALDMISPHLNEKTSRLFLAVLALIFGYGGISELSKLSGISKTTISKGIDEINEDNVEPDRIRKAGGGRKPKIEEDKTLIEDLTLLLEDSTRGNPETKEKWTSKSTRVLAKELTKMGHIASHTLVCKLLHQLGYSLQANKKSIEGNQHQDRDKQFSHINKMENKALEQNQPVISVDTKKKEQIGNFCNAGQVWRPIGNPLLVNGHDFNISDLKVSPFGVYDIGLNQGFVNLGTDHDTPEFAVASIRRWWMCQGVKDYPNAKYILITADAGGSNSYRSRVFKADLQKLSIEIGIPIHVCHYPPGTSKWNKIEHKLFSFISINWRGQPLESIEIMMNFINNTTTESGLIVKAVRDNKKYPLGKKISNDEFSSIKLFPNKFHGEWNYTIKP
jgi:transposase